MLKRTAFRQIRPAFPPKLRDREPAEPPTVRPLVRGSYGRCDEVTAVPKEPASRSESLKRLADGEECCGCMGAVCSPDTTVWAHANLLSERKGMGYKANEHTGAFLGYWCHKKVDQAAESFEVRQELFALAQERTRERLAQIATDPLTRPWKREAARWALEQLKEKA